MVDKGEGFALVPRNETCELQVQARDEVGLAKTAGSSRLSDRQVVVANRAKKEGLPRVNLARVIRLEADGALAVHPDLRGVSSPLVVMSLHPGFAGSSVTIVAGLVIPLPRCTAGDISPRIFILCSLAAQPGSQLLIAAAKTIFGHADNDAIADTVIQIRPCRGLASMTFAHDRVDHADINLTGGGFLGGLGRLGGGDLGCDNRSGGGSSDGQRGQCAGQEPCSRVPRVSCARSTRSH
jgi:hypothetical protein